MIEPSVALQTALRSALLADPNVTALVTPDNIRAGSTRPDKAPCIIMASPSTRFLGRAAGDQLLAEVSVDLHIWALEDGAETAKTIGYAASRSVLAMSEDQDGFTIDELSQPRMIWLRDPQPELSFTHGIFDLEAVIRWAT